MPIFRYRAYNASGKEVSGELEAQAPRDAAERLRQEGLFARDISAKKTAKGLFTRSVSETALASAIRQLSTLLNAGTPLFEALSIIASETESPLLSDALNDVRQRVGEGASLSRALGAHQSVFPEFLVRVAEAGEESGTLEEALLRVAEYLDSKASFREKVASALVYPAVMIVVGAGVLFFLFAYVLPRITEVFEDTQRALPLVTRALFFMVNGVSAYWYVILGLVAGAFFALRKALRTEKGREAWERAILRLPAVGSAYRRFQAASFSATLGNLLLTGIPIVKALDLTSKVISASIYKKAVQKATAGVVEGAGLSTSLKGSGLFPAMLTQMVSTGERSGELGRLLVKAASFYEKEFDTSVARALALLEPGLILAMGLIVGFIVLAILLPIFELNQVVG
jgi:general secretion pathway protein F